MKFASPEHIDVLARGFIRQAALCRKLNVETFPNQMRILVSLVQAIVEDAEAVVLLGSQGFGNQMTMVLRGFTERVVTFFYVQVIGEDERKAYFQYSAQKTYQISRQSVQIDGKDGRPIEIKFQGNLELFEVPEYKEAVDRFTSQGGKPKTRWSNTSIEKKLAAVKESKVIDTGGLELLVFSIYDDASEALHGTIYGCIFHLGFLQPGGPFVLQKEQQTDQHRRHLTNCFLLGGSALHDLNAFLFKKSNQLDLLGEAKEAQDIVNKSLVEAMKESRSSKSSKSGESDCK